MSHKTWHSKEHAKRRSIGLLPANSIDIGQNTNESNGWYCVKSSRATIVNCNDAEIVVIGKAENGFR